MRPYLVASPKPVNIAGKVKETSGLLLSTNYQIKEEKIYKKKQKLYS